MRNNRSIYTNIGVFTKRITGIQDIASFRKSVHKFFGKMIYHKKYTALELVNLMKKMGMGTGSIVCIHCAMKEFYNYRGTAEELIEKILEVIGTDGTLVMPAFPEYKVRKSPDYVFNALSDKTGAGYLAETFRKYPGVKRSINVRHSVCAIGKMADFLVNGHELCDNCWDENSPWYKMCQMNALVFNLGMPRSYMGTFHHCVESILRNEHPYFAQFFNLPTVNYYYDREGNICEYKSLECGIERRTRKKKVTKYFGPNDWRIERISNLEVKVFYSKNALNKMLDLGRKGVTVFYVPSTRNFEF